MLVTLDTNLATTDISIRRALASLSSSVSKSKRIVVVTGAGISCSCGIPDFRSSDGLYALVKAKYPDTILKGRDLFDVSLFRDPTSTSLFYTFMAGLKSSIDLAIPSPTHHFIKTLDTKGKLLRSYTQNIDGLEERAGLACSSSESVQVTGKAKRKLKTKEVRNVQLHGDIHRLRCLLCAASFKCTSEYLEIFRQGNPPDCPECKTRSEERIARSARALKIGTLRPSIVLYGEPHPLGDDIGAIQTADLAKKPDMLIIMGTSLKVHGLRKLVKELARAVHDHKSGAGKVVFVNKTAPASEWDGIIDYHVAGETDAWTTKLIDEWKKSRPQDWEVQQTLRSETLGDKAFKVVKQPTTGKIKKGGKTRDPNAENIPPQAASTLTRRPTTTLPTPPLSPSKRKVQYQDADCSPSKKRGTVPQPAMPGSERGMLFTKPLNEPVVEIVVDSSEAKKARDTPKAAPTVSISADEGTITLIPLVIEA